jgi:hypothetical protein
LEGAGRIQALTPAPPDNVYPQAIASENTGESVSDAQIDSLLGEAMQALATEEGSANQSSVDPLMLLAQAEDELDLTFREQILEKLKTEYNKIRNSVADRSKQP